MDYCYGTGTVHWSDDSYAQGSHPCTGCSAPNCPAKKEVPVALTPPSNPSEPTHVVVVKVPVTIASIGQRDQLERHATHMVVEFDGSNVTLRSDPPVQAGTDSITFPWAGIEAAIGVLGD